MTKIYNDACDKNVAAVVVFKDAENALFYDANHTDAVDPGDCLNLFQKGVILNHEGTFYAAVSCTSAGVIDFGL